MFIRPIRTDDLYVLNLGFALAQCLQESDCIMLQRNSPQDCLKSPLLEELPTRCQQLRKSLGECK